MASGTRLPASSSDAPHFELLPSTVERVGIAKVNCHEKPAEIFLALLPFPSDSLNGIRFVALAAGIPLPQGEKRWLQRNYAAHF